MYHLGTAAKISHAVCAHVDFYGNSEAHQPRVHHLSLTRVTKSYLLALGTDYPDKLLFHQALWFYSPDMELPRGMFRFKTV